MIRWQRSSVAVLVLGLVSGCGGSPSSPAPMQSTLAVESLDAVPSQSLQDWTSYGQQLVVATVLSESEVPNPAIAEHGEGTTNREVVIRIDRTLWADSHVKPLTGAITLLAHGWAYSDGQRQTLVDDEGPRLEIGGQYLLPLTRFTTGVGPVSTSAVTQVVDGRVLATSGQRSAAIEKIQGKTLEEVASIVVGTQPDPYAARHMDLAPEARWRAVLSDLGRR